MKPLVLFFALAGVLRAGDADERMADAVWFAEGGVKARVPYGVLSVRVRDEREARAVCLRTISRARADWTRGGRRGCFVDFFAERWCPPVADARGAKNLKRNLRFFMREQL